LRRVEGQLLGAERRIAELKDHLAALRRIESAVNVELNSCSASSGPANRVAC
jgi:hypothetical protein